MKANYQMADLPQNGVQVTVEGKMVRLLFDFVKCEHNSENESASDDDDNDYYDCESVDVCGRTYGELVSGIMNDRYNSDSVQAIMANYAEAIDSESDITPEKRAEYISEYEQYQSYRKHAKEIARIAVELI